MDTSEEQHVVEQFLELLDKDIEASQSMADFPATLEQSMLTRLGKPLDPSRSIRSAVEI